MLLSRIQPCPDSCLYQITVRGTRPGDDKLRYTMPEPQPLAPDPTATPATRQLPPGALAILRRGAASGRLTHVERLPALPGVRAPWPDWVPPGLVTAFGRVGVGEPWTHQAAAADFARAGRNVILATGTASGKSVGYLAPALTAIGEGATALYLAPTRALAADQLNLLHVIGGAAGRGLGLRPAVVDSDTPYHQRAWARRHATYLLTTPDMLHYGLLPQHERWSGFLRRLRYVVVDECHGYRGVFGSHVAHVLRRLRRVAAHHGEPGGPGLVFVLASATISDPARSAELLTGPATCRRRDENWRRRCGPERSRRSRQPRRWNSASTSPAWTRSSSPDGRGPWRRFGSRRAGLGAR